MTRLPQLPLPSPPTGRSEWFEDGVRFRCLGQECGACCSGKLGPGVVWVTHEDAERLATHLSLTRGGLQHRYLRRLEGRWCLRERANYDCIFYDPGRGCSVYEARPTQCRTYPFWGRILASPVTWRYEAEKCPGIGCDATRVTAEEVRRQLEIDERRKRR
jgi:Fe-S-cluster containining protein